MFPVGRLVGEIGSKYTQLLLTFRCLWTSGFWRPGSKQEIALVNLVPRGLTGTFFEMPCTERLFLDGCDYCLYSDSLVVVFKIPVG
jgi:hypothetical protein